jgi:hypothetical protein
MKPSRIRVRLFAVCGIVTMSLALVSALAVAAERPSNPAPLLVWLLSLNQREQGPKINVNSATVEALTAVPGVDRRQALRIIANRPYAKLQDLARSGLSTRFIERLTGFLTVDPPSAEHASGPGSGAAPATRSAAPGR